MRFWRFYRFGKESKNCEQCGKGGRGEKRNIGVCQEILGGGSVGGQLDVGVARSVGSCLDPDFELSRVVVVGLSHDT